MAQIIPEKPLTVESHWQKELATAYKSPESLLKTLDLDTDKYQKDIEARKLFPMIVPQAFVSRMEKGNRVDPLLLQVFPDAQEFGAAPGFTADPLLEQNNENAGLLHKYQSRVLLVVKGGCAVNCRYCFRRHFPYQDNALRKQDWLPVFDYIAADKAINEVIYSGGDPLMAKDDFLLWMTKQLEAIEHVKTLRIHTRLPVVIPNRITPELLEWFTQTRLKPVMVVHINHANEIDDPLNQKLQLLHSSGVTLLNQSVLLKGINDNADALIELHEKLFEADVLPYYLHMLDKVEGASHFNVSDDRARQIVAEVIKRQPGYLVPKLVREIGGQPGKTPMDLRLHP
ncbi:EF-P beta-lysylation protein EpmB [Planctobacterium marinum]|uniref:L-lysine 2,3-aminomutase n=1 Tax=Planctobacterium marinum TaxID=1631968 RepID=A0AA48HKS9_9ALTE|nr:EF-P beta-lysylation protein EpmB [Planctobacterium marinum]